MKTSQTLEELLAQKEAMDSERKKLSAAISKRKKAEEAELKKLAYTDRVMEWVALGKLFQDYLLTRDKYGHELSLDLSQWNHIDRDIYSRSELLKSLYPELKEMYFSRCQNFPEFKAEVDEKARIEKEKREAEKERKEKAKARREAKKAEREAANANGGNHHEN